MTFVFSFPVTFHFRIASPFTSVSRKILIKYQLSMGFQNWVNEKYVRYVTNRHTNITKKMHFHCWNVLHDMCKMGWWSFWSWFDVNRSTFDEDMHEAEKHFRSSNLYLISVSPNLWSAQRILLLESSSSNIPFCSRPTGLDCAVFYVPANTV